MFPKLNTILKPILIIKLPWINCLNCELESVASAVPLNELWTCIHSRTIYYPPHSRKRHLLQFVQTINQYIIT